MPLLLCFIFQIYIFYKIDFNFPSFQSFMCFLSYFMISYHSCIRLPILQTTDDQCACIKAWLGIWHTARGIAKFLVRPFTVSQSEISTAVGCTSAQHQKQYWRGWGAVIHFAFSFQYYCYCYCYCYYYHQFYFYFYYIYYHDYDHHNNHHCCVFLPSLSFLSRTSFPFKHGRKWSKS